MQPIVGGKSKRIDGHVRRRDVQGLRAIAVLFVVVFHARIPLPGGFTGVDIFFVISGFVITGTLASELAGTGHLQISNFYVRRVKRLLPALALMLVAVGVLGTLAAPVSSMPVAAKTGIFASLFAANGYLYRINDGGYFAQSASLNPLLHTWTLGVEEQFYVVFPLLLLGSWFVAGRWFPGRRLAVSLAVAGGSMVSLGLAYRTPQTFTFYGSPTRAWEFGSGALVALLAPFLARLPRPVANTLGALGAAVVIGAGALIGNADPLPSAVLLPVAGACALLIAGTPAAGTGISRLLAAPPLVWIGDRSYSWYLWHWPLIVFAIALWPLTRWAPAAAAAISLVPAALSYRYVENPVRFNPRIRGRRTLALGVVCVLLPLGVCLAWRDAVSRLAHASSALAAVDLSQEASVGQMHNCFGAFEPGSASTTACTWTVGASRGSAVLLGDSTATSLTGAFVVAANKDGLDATSATLPGCPFVDLLVSGGFHTESACREYYVDSMRALIRAKPSVVVLETTSTYVRSDIVPDTLALGAPGTTGRTTQPAARATLWRAGLTSVVHQLNAVGVPVLLVMPTPITAVTPSSCAVLRVLTSSCQGTRTRAAVDNERRPMVDADAEVVRAAAGGVSRVDFINLICGPQRCPTIGDGRPVYTDQLHLSVAESATLTTPLEAAIRKRLRSQSARLVR